LALGVHIPAQDFLVQLTPFVSGWSLSAFSRMFLAEILSLFILHTARPHGAHDLSSKAPNARQQLTVYPPFTDGQEEEEN
jgi:hypothetical protein